MMSRSAFVVVTSWNKIVRPGLPPSSQTPRAVLSARAARARAARASPGDVAARGLHRRSAVPDSAGGDHPRARAGRAARGLARVARPPVN